MGTRGTLGVRIDGEDKLCYNQFDCYPDGLGFDALADIKSMLKDWGLHKMITQARKLTLVDNNVPPTPEQIKELSPFTDLGVSNQSTDDWYCVLRDLQGRLCDHLTVGYMLGNNDFINESLFCEWGYILNLDDNVMEVYQGFQEKPHDMGRYADNRSSDFLEREERNKELSPDDWTNKNWYPCALIATFSLDNLPTEQEFMITINRFGFDCEEDMVLNHMEDYGEISIAEAKERFGINDFNRVLERLEIAGKPLVLSDGDNMIYREPEGD